MRARSRTCSVDEGGCEGRSLEQESCEAQVISEKQKNFRLKVKVYLVKLEEAIFSHSLSNCCFTIGLSILVSLGCVVKLQCNMRLWSAHAVADMH